VIEEYVKSETVNVTVDVPGTRTTGATATRTTGATATRTTGATATRTTGATATRTTGATATRTTGATATRTTGATATATTTGTSGYAADGSDVDYSDSSVYTTIQEAYDSGSTMTYYGEIADTYGTPAPEFVAGSDASTDGYLIYYIPDDATAVMEGNASISQTARDAAADTDGTARYVDPNTGGAAPGYQGDFVSAALGGGTTNLGDQ
jgi:hypothetical protein